MSEVHRCESRRFGAVGFENFQAPEDPKAGALHAEPAQAAVRHVAHDGQRGDLFLAAHTVYFHIQVSCGPHRQNESEDDTSQVTQKCTRL